MQRVVVIVSLLLLGASVAAQPSTATVSVASFHDRLVECMQLGGEHAAREAVLAKPIAELFDLPTIARVSVGRKWRELDEAQRSKFIGLLSQVVVATYADRFDSFNDQVFETLQTREVRNGEVVQTQIRRANGSTVTLDYFFRNDKVFNVVADGVSDLSLRRADYSAIIKERGFEALLDHLVVQLGELRGEDA